MHNVSPTIANICIVLFVVVVGHCSLLYRFYNSIDFFVADDFISLKKGDVGLILITFGRNRVYMWSHYFNP